MKVSIIDDMRSNSISVELAHEDTESEERTYVESMSGGNATLIGFIDTDSADFDPHKATQPEAYDALDSLAAVKDSSHFRPFDTALSFLMTRVLAKWREYERANRDELIRVEQARERLGWSGSES